MFLNKLRTHPSRFLAFAAVAGAVLGAVIAQAIPAMYQVSLPFTINQRARQETADYAYDGYYALKASEVFADTLTSWFGTPSVVVEIYRMAQVPLADEDAARAANGFKIKKLSAQNVLVRYQASTHAEAEALATAAAKVVSEKASELNKNSKGESLFVIKASAPVISIAALSPLRAAFIGFLLGILIAIAALYFASPPARS